MSSHETTNKDSSLSEFSSVLLDNNTEDTDQEDTIVDISSNGYESVDNNHLSSVLSQIQDEGPAYEETISSDDKASDVTNAVAESEASDNNSEQLSKQHNIESVTGVSQQNLLLKKFLSKLNRFVGMSQVAFILITVVTAGYMFFNLNSRTSNLENTLAEQDSNLEEIITAQGDDLEPKVLELNKALTLIESNLELVETKYEILDNKYDAVIQKNITTMAKDTVLIKNNIDVLEEEILALKTKIKVIRNNNKVVAKSNVVIEKNNTSSKVLTVNLASLTNIKKVDELVNKLYTIGLSPSVEKAVVQNKQVYRISVSGFQNLKAAKLFINNAAKKYGTTGARIRKS